MSPALNGSPAIWCFECSDAIEIRNGIIFDFYTGLPHNMKGTEVPNPRRSSACDCTCVLTRIDHCLVNNRSCHACQMCLVLFLYLCKVCSRVSSEALLLVLRTLSLSFPTNNPSSDSKAFLCFIAFSGSPTAVHCAFLSSMRRHGYSHKLISSRAQRYYTVHIPISDT